MFMFLIKVYFDTIYLSSYYLKNVLFNLTKYTFDIDTW